MPNQITLDGNEAVARIAYALSEVIAVYPITPASSMGELADAWSSMVKPNVFGTVPLVTEMQSEGGAAGVLHGALQGGALATTFTASQGLLLMIPNMFKIEGEMTACVIHVAARSVATHALSIFGDHSDVMAVRSTGFAMLSSASVQEAHDLALISHAASLKSRIPFLHFFDGFRTSHEVNKIYEIDEETIRSFIDAKALTAHRERGLDPERPVLRGTAQNPDVFFQSREATNQHYADLPDVVQLEMDRLYEQTGRRYKLFEYIGSPTAKRIVVIMGSGSLAVEEAVERLNGCGEEVGLVRVHLYRPFDVRSFVASIPESVKCIAVLDRTKEPGSLGEPLYLDIVAALAEGWHGRKGPIPRVIGGRYGLASKEFTPAMVLAIYRQLNEDQPKQHFTIGIHDDVTRTSLNWDEADWNEEDYVTRAVFFGLGSDGTVGANRNSVKIIGEETSLHSQGYFVFDSKKSGSVTASHLRFSPKPIRSSYLIQKANIVACHQFDLLFRTNVVEYAKDHGTLLLNCCWPPDQVWDHLPIEAQRLIMDRKLKLFAIDANNIAGRVGLNGRINTIMQTCFFALAEVIPKDDAIARIKASIEKSFRKLGATVVARNFDAVDSALAQLHEVTVPSQLKGGHSMLPALSSEAPDIVRRVQGMIIAGKGNLLPVSALPLDGTFPTGTARYEKRSIANEIPIWDSEICIECGLCVLVCPHAAIRAKRMNESDLKAAPLGFPFRRGKDDAAVGELMSIQVAPDDCTGCGVCVDICPAKSKVAANYKAINMRPKSDHLDRERQRFDYFMKLPDADRTKLKTDTVKGSQLLLPLFEYSGACGGCGETPYLKLLSQLFGVRSVVANATGCSSIFGGSLPTTPWSQNADGCGPAWSNSLFEDNAEFGLGLRLALDGKLQRARSLLASLREEIGPVLVQSILDAEQSNESQLATQRAQLVQLRSVLQTLRSEVRARELESLVDVLLKRSLWIVGGDGWAYDIGFGGLDHVLASGRDVNILVLDTGGYSNTGGQASKSTPRGASAKFAANGCMNHRKDLGAIAMAYGSIYVAQVAIGANPAQCVRAFTEAESFQGPSLILAYCPCIAHGIDMSTSMSHQKDLVKSGFWPLYRYDPRQAHAGCHPFHLDSHKPAIPFREVALKEARFAMLARSKPDRSAHLLQLAQRDIDEAWHYYQQLSGVEREYFDGATS